MDKLVSVITTVYNGARFIAATIESILAQSYGKFEFIIVNDGSTDNTSDIIRSFSDLRIKYIELEENRGVGEAISLALSYAQGDYIAKVDGDDVYEPSRFFQQVQYLNEHPDVDLVDTQISFFADDELVEHSNRYQYLKDTFEKEVNDIIEIEDIAKKLYWFPCITHSAVMFRASVFEKFSYRFLRVGDDYDLFYRMNKAGMKIAKLPNLLANIRVSSYSTTVIEERDMILGKFHIKDEELLSPLSQGRRIFIWGTGQLGRTTLEYVSNKGGHVVGFIDNKATAIGTIVESIEVYNKSYLINGDFIYVASTLGKYEISEYLEAKGFKHIDDYMVIL